jgi:alpha-glucosidase
VTPRGGLNLRAARYLTGWMRGSSGHLWWQRGVVYQVYPRSFMDASGDGVGDLPGITSRLEYLRWLGVDAVWISPFYSSPMADFGYDISDYKDVHPLFGTLEDFDGLVAEAHGLGLKVILDYVPNHTSGEHRWFVQSRSSRENPKRDWYIWRDPAPGGGPPNNWRSVFGGPAWTFDEATGQYYYHAYLREQPDLNWRNPEVREAMYDVLRFWLERGVDGFRVDALRQLVKDERLRDNPPNPDPNPRSPYDALLPVYSTDRPETHEAIREMRGVLEEYGDRLLIGELYLPIDRLVTYYGEANSGVHLPFNFHLISTPWRAREISTLIETYEAALPEGAWPTWVLGNHDRSRIASRVGPAQARVAAMLLFTLRGTPTLYYGDELGMRDVEIPPDLVQDPFEKNVPGRGLGRDPARTPMQWDATPNAGFTTGSPWLPLADDHRTANVALEREDPASMLNLHRRLLELRRSEPALALGSYEPVAMTDDLLAYARERDGRGFLVLLNLGSGSRTFGETDGRLVLSTHLDRDGESASGEIELRANEGVILEQG